MKFILDQIFVLDTDQNKFYDQTHVQKVVHIIGTPGFGKSCNFCAFKLIMDLRIKHLI